MFAHLHVHNEFSLLDGLGKASQYAERAKELGQRYIALTNHANIDGLVRLQTAAKKVGIKPVMGCELYIVPNLTIKEKEERFHITALIKNQTGFENLCQLLSLANLKGFYSKPRVDFQSVLRYREGLVFLTGCGSSPIQTAAGRDFVEALWERIPGDVYLEVMPHNLENQIKVNKWALQMNEALGIPMVATNDCHYVNKGDDELQAVLLAIQTKKTWSDKARWSFSENRLYLRSAAEMKEAFAEQGVLSKGQYNNAIGTTIEVAEKCCDFEIKKREIYLPELSGNAEDDEARMLRIIEAGHERIFGMPLKENKAYFSRVQEEFALIQKKGFVRYFLIVEEIVSWCAANGIMTGPGRGSVGGSLMAYLMGITKVDPLKYNLIFSRFIADDRIDYPDIDLDFEDVKRFKIREHLEERYGKNNISSVSTFLKMKGRLVIRDVARVFEVPYKEVDEFAKVIFDDDEYESSVQAAAEGTEEGRRFAAAWPQVVDFAVRLEGQIRGVSQHAAALIVSAEDLTKGTRGNIAVRSEQEVINWEMNDAEYLGLMKLDILGLNTLSVLNETKRLVMENHGKLIEFEKLSLDNEKVFEAISRGETVGIFQFNTWATTKLAKELGIENFGLMSDVVALVRPGVADSGMAGDFVKRKHGGKWKKKHPMYERIAKDTFGVIVYQEQVMEIFYKLAGLSYSVADKIRKIIGKKRDVKEFAQYKQMFIDGCKAQDTLTEPEANEFWEALEKHANYSFNKSHSVEYAMLAYWCAFCKVFYPAEFICANLSYGSEGKKEDLVKEAKRLGLNIVLPRVGISDARKWAVKAGSIYVPFIEIKGVGEKSAEDCARFKAPRKDDFFVTNNHKSPGKIEKILDAIGAIDGNPKGDVSAYFDFDVSPPAMKYPYLRYILQGYVADAQLERFLRLDIKEGELKGQILQRRYRADESLFCAKCELRSKAKNPVLPSFGLYNIPVVGEAPGRDENEEGKGFIGKAGEVLWKELWKYGMTRRQFHVCNVCRCYPAEIKTPRPEHIEACGAWLDKEFEELKPRIGLCLGNSPLQFFRGQSAGITALSGTTEWNEKYRMWVCYSLHPAAVLRDPSNRMVFEAGVRNFAEKIVVLGGLK